MLPMTWRFYWLAFTFGITLFGTASPAQPYGSETVDGPYGSELIFHPRQEHLHELTTPANEETIPAQGQPSPFTFEPRTQTQPQMPPAQARQQFVFEAKTPAPTSQPVLSQILKVDPAYAPLVDAVSNQVASTFTQGLASMHCLGASSIRPVSQLRSLADPLPAAMTKEELNNAAVEAIKAGHHQSAIAYLEEALRQDKDYRLARHNLSIAYNNHALSISGNTKAALKLFRHALYLRPQDEAVAANVRELTLKLGRNPYSFNDHMTMGDDCLAAADNVGAVIEFEEALKVRPDDILAQARLNDARKQLADSAR